MGNDRRPQDDVRIVVVGSGDSAKGWAEYINAYAPILDAIAVPMVERIEEQFDYMAEADKTCSVIFKPEQVQKTYFVAVLQSIVDAGEELNVAKKLLFRGKTPEDMGRTYPLLENSLAMNFPEGTVTAEIDLLHGIIGVITEAGEMAEVLLHRLKTGEFDRVNAFEEVGDVTWYLARQLRGMNADFDMSNRANIDKLHGRHGDAFNVFRDANRNLAEERSKLETAAPLFDMEKEAAHVEDMLDGDLPADDRGPVRSA